METKGSLVTINIDGKPLEKLIDAVSKGIGTLYRPRKIRKEADAEAYAIKVIENARAVADSDLKIIEAETAERIGQRMIAKEVRRQENIDSVVEMAADNLNGVDVSDKPVDEDWAIRFFDIVQDVSEEDLKVLWSKILSREITKPSSFSLRTLEVLRNVSREEAELFVKLADFVFMQNSGCFVFNGENGLDEYDLYYSDLNRLREAGLLQSGEFVSKKVSPSKTSEVILPYIYGSQFIQVTLPPNTKDFMLPVLVLSQAGFEIYHLIDRKLNIKYLKSFAAFIKKENSSAIVQYSNIVKWEGDRYWRESNMKSL